MSIAIVGNSGSLLKHGYGRFIDDHQKVVRFNVAPTEGFEKHVGSRTTNRFVCYNEANNYDVLNMENILLYSYSKKARTEGYKLLWDRNMVLFLEEKFIRKCDNMIAKPYWKWWLKQGLGFDRIIVHKTMSTTGLKAIVYTMEREKHIDLFGFDTDGLCEKYHYYQENRPGYNLNDYHDHEKEIRIIKGFEREGKLSIF